MRQIVSAGQGQCGIAIQEQTWLTLLREQGLDNSGVGIQQNLAGNVNVYFDEVKENVYRPRSHLMDIDETKLNQLESGSLNQFFQGTPMIRSSMTSMNNYARGKYTIGGELRDSAEETLRQQVEKCDSLDSIQITRSACGGAGSGLGSLFIELAREFYCADMVNSIVHLPSLDDISNNVLEIYNTVHSFHMLIELSDIVIPFTNESIQQISEQSISIKKNNAFEDVNAIVGQIHPGISCSLRYPGTLNASTRKMGTNIIPYPRIKFLSLSYLPLNYYRANHISAPSYTDMISECLNPEYFIYDRNKPEVFCSQHIIRGSDISEEEVETGIYNLYKNKVKTIEWISNSASLSYCSRPSEINQKSMLSIINSKAIYESFRKYQEKFYNSFKRKSFVWVYTQEGMDEMEFKEAESNLIDLISETQPCNCYEEESGEFEDDFSDH